MTVAICDDEIIFIEQMETLIKDIPEIEKYDTYTDLRKLWESLKKGKNYDLIFMDIDWKEEKNGISYAAKINDTYPEIQIIFVTAFNDRFSQEIFFEPVNLCGYLVKPVNMDNLNVLLEKAKKNLEKNQKKRLAVQYRGKTEVIPHRDITYLESKGHQVIIHTIKGELTIYDKLEEIGRKLSDGFLCIHKSFWVNMDKIQKLDGKNLLLKDETILPISKSRVVTAKETYLRYMRSQM
ncbi:MAG: LytR/AlgR family response regulator transcription factor [Lachnospiraceae bacterium]